MKPALSIVIPNWNGKHQLVRCLPTLRAQTEPGIEIIIVDNGSTDGSNAWIESEYPEALIIPLETNTGFAYAVNKGIEKASAELILLLGNDTELEPHFAEAMLRAAQAYPDYDAFSSRMLRRDGSGSIDGIGDQLHADATFSKIGHFLPNGPAFDVGRDVFGPSASAGVYRRRYFDIVGLFDADFFIGYDDPDINMRARLMRLAARYVPDAIGYHEEHGTVEVKSDLIRYLMFRNRLYFLIKNLPARFLARHFGIIARPLIWGFVKDIGKAVLRRPDSGVPIRMKAYAALLKHLPRLMRQRLSIQSRKKVDTPYLESFIVPLLRSREADTSATR